MFINSQLNKQRLVAEQSLSFQLSCVLESQLQDIRSQETANNPCVGVLLL